VSHTDANADALSKVPALTPGFWPDHHGARRDILLGYDHVFANARYRARRLGGRQRARLFGRRAAVRGRVRLLALLYFAMRISHVALFWAAFILTRPLGATVGDFLNKPVASGGLKWSRSLASAVLAAMVAVLIQIVPQRPGQHPASRRSG
jgi:hypothetical protein